jgi:hypothetical protein
MILTQSVIIITSLFLVFLKDIAGKMEVSHLSNCGKHVYYKMWSGLECAICKWSNKTFRIVQ